LSPKIVRSLLAAGVGTAATLGAALPAWALSVTVDGQAVTFNPPPIERAGRVFVPLRGVFERLGASVVYANGTINATGNGRNIQLHIGSNAATVNGSAQTLDQAPFVIGASTYVPLRFVSEALGAGVNYDGANQIVALSANFAQPVDPNSLQLTLDGLDISRDATRSDTGFIYAPPSPLQSRPHAVTVSGNLASGQPFQESWHFSTGASSYRNSLSILSPIDGSGVGRTFVVRGRSVPYALVHVDAGASANFVGRSFAFGTGNASVDTTADGNGNFSVPVSVRAFPGATIGVTITSTDPQSRESAQKKLQLSSSP
jgi:predicted secreted protein